VSLDCEYTFFFDFYALVLSLLPAKIMNGGIAHPVALMQQITVTHSLLPGWIVFRFPHLSEPVTSI